jgi:succinate dehydrogenase / fumarate reductase membrane anchor subunit
MGQQNADLRSSLSRARGLGSAHHGVGHWWWQRVTALAIIPLSLYFLSALLTTMLTPDITKVAEWLAYPLNALVIILLLVAAFYHAKLGLQVVIEDYVKGPFPKYGLLMLNTFFCFVFTAIGVVAVLKLHFLDIVSTSL